MAFRNVYTVGVRTETVSSKPATFYKSDLFAPIEYEIRRRYVWKKSELFNYTKQIIWY